MEMKQTTDRTYPIRNNIVEPLVNLSRDGQYIHHYLPDGKLVRKHINFYKAILGVPFTKKASQQNQPQPDRVA